MGKAAEDAIITMESLGETITELGISKVATQSGLAERIIRKFTVNPLTSKNSDITKIKAAVKTLTLPPAGN